MSNDLRSPFVSVVLDRPMWHQKIPTHLSLDSTLCCQKLFIVMLAGTDYGSQMYKNV